MQSISAPPHLKIGATYPIVIEPFKVCDLRQGNVSSSILNLTSRFKAKASQEVSQIDDAHVMAFATAPLFEIGDSTHQALHQLAVSLFTAEHAYMTITAQKIQPNRSILISGYHVQTLSHNSEFIPDDIQEDGVSIVSHDHKTFPFIETVLAAFDCAKKKLPLDQQQKLTNWNKLPTELITITLQKNATTGSKPHVDTHVQAVFGLPIPALSLESNQGSISPKKQTTLYKTKHAAQGIKADFKYLPVGQAMIMFPGVQPLQHYAPPLQGIPTEPTQARYILTFSIQAKELLKGQETALTTFGIKIGNS